MAKLQILILLIVAGFLPCGAQERHLKPIQGIGAELKKATTDTGKANQLLNLALSYVYKPGEYANDLDSALLLVKQAESINAHLHNPKIEAKAYFVYSNAFREGGKTEAGKQYIEKSLEVYKTNSDPSAMASAWLELANYYSIYVSKEVTSQKRKCFEQALILIKTTGNKERQADILKDLGDLDQILGDAGQAMKELNEALSIYISVGHKKLQGVYDLMGYTCGRKGDLPDAVKFGLLAVKTAEEVNDTTLQLCTIYHRLSMAYNHWSKYEQALPYSKRAMSIAIKYKDRWSILATLEMVCRLLSSLGREAESLGSIHVADSALEKPRILYDSIVINTCYLLTYVDAQKYDKAKAYFSQLETLLKRYPKNTAPYYTYQCLVRYYLATQQYERAGRIMSEYLSYLIPRHEKRALAQAYKLNSQLDSARGDFKSALVNHELYKNTTDSMLNEATTFQFAQMEVEHETEKKDNDIQILQQQEIIQEANLKQSWLFNNIVIGGVVILALLLTLLYSRYRTRQRLNRQLQTKQEEINEKNIKLENLVSDKDQLLKQKEWLIKEIHHRVKNNLQIVISLLNAQSEFLNNPSAINAIRESRERMEAIAIIHQRLYQTEGSARIGMRSYISELVENIKNSFVDSGRVFFQVDIEDVDLDISQSVPLGLILNEAITNAMKYAYPKNEKGTLHISLQRIGLGELQVKVADHGKGLPGDMNIEQSNTLGLQLIKLFSEQLEGDLFFINNEGLEIMLNFKTAEYISPIPDRVTA